MFKAYVIVLVLHAGFVFQGCAGLEYLDGSSRKERTKFKMTKEEMWNEMERLRIGNSKLERQIGTLEKESQRIRHENENTMAMMTDQNVLLNAQVDRLKEENQRIRDQNENTMVMMRDQNALLNEQIEKLREENQRIRHENQVLTKKLTMLQVRRETPSSQSYELKKEGYKTKLMYVQERSVRVRSGPGTDYRTVGGRRFGDKILTKGLEGDWYRVVDSKDSDKTIGWIHRSLLGKMPVITDLK